jgi:para-nitrobenzyl esterase
VLAEHRARDRVGAKGVLAAMAPEDIAAWLRQKSATELLSVFAAHVLGGMYFTPAIVRDGHVIPDRDPLEVLATPGAYNAVPTIAGTNRDETRLFNLMGSPHVRRLFELPVGLRDAEAYAIDSEYGSLAWQAQGANEPLEAMRAGGRSDVYGYRFDWDEEGRLLWLDLSELLCAAHGIELLFVFGFTDLGRWTGNVYADVASAERLSAGMRSYWTHFARTGAPGRGTDGSLPAWESWAAAPASRHLVLDTEAGGGIRMERDPVSVEDVVARLAADPRLGSADERCTILRGLVEFARFVDATGYAAFGDGLCLPWPLEPPDLYGG